MIGRVTVLNWWSSSLETGRGISQILTCKTSSQKFYTGSRANPVQEPSIAIKRCSATIEVLTKFCTLIVYTTTHCSLKAYCAIWVRRSNFRHQASPRVSLRESTQRRKVELGEKCPVILPKCRFTRYIQGSFTCRKATTWDRRLYFLSEGRRAEEFFALKIRRLRPSAKPRTWVPKASTLLLDHRSRFEKRR